MSRFAINDLSLAGLKIVERQRLGNSRDFLSRPFYAKEMVTAELGRLAHAFQALTDDVELVFYHSAAYKASAEAGLSLKDPRLLTRWPRLSCRDTGHALIQTGFKEVSS